jgi:uncharacterized repeat protein (TIGR01451 family)
MSVSETWAILNVRLARAVPLVIATASIGFASPAAAAGTTAGTTISNTATATYNDNGGNPQTATSNQVDLLVDELLDVTVVSADPGDVQTVPGATNQVLSFDVTNTGNGSEAFRLTPSGTLGGDQFDPAVTSIVLDTNGNDAYDPGVDTVYTAGANDPVLAPDASIRVFVLSTIPAGTSNNDRGQATLTAAAVTGTGAPGTSFAGQGQGGGAAVVGSTGADGVDDGFYLVQNATISFTKSQSVADPFGGTTVVPGSIITYTLTATISGSGSLTNLLVTDSIPANTTYRTGTMTLQGSGLSDPPADDAGTFVAPVTGPPAVPGRVEVTLGTVPAGQTRVVTFQVTVN